MVFANYDAMPQYRTSKDPVLERAKALNDTTLDRDMYKMRSFYNGTSRAEDHFSAASKSISRGPGFSVGRYLQDVKYGLS